MRGLGRAFISLTVIARHAPSARRQGSGRAKVFFVAVAALAVPLLVTPATEAGATPVAEIATRFVDYGTQANLDYARSECMAECPLVSFICEPNSAPAVWLTALPSSEIVSWLFGVSYEEGNQPTADLILDGVSFTLVAEELSYGGGGDMHQNWWVKLRPVDNLLALFGRAQGTAIQSAAFEIALPSTPEERANRAAFVEACLAM